MVIDFMSDLITLLHLHYPDVMLSPGHQWVHASLSSLQSPKRERAAPPASTNLKQPSDKGPCQSAWHKPPPPGLCKDTVGRRKKPNSS